MRSNNNGLSQPSPPGSRPVKLTTTMGVICDVSHTETARSSLLVTGEIFRHILDLDNICNMYHLTPSSSSDTIFVYEILRYRYDGDNSRNTNQHQPVMTRTEEIFNYQVKTVLTVRAVSGDIIVS